MASDLYPPAQDSALWVHSPCRSEFGPGERRQPCAEVWLSPPLINGPVETCPATLEPHVSPAVHTGPRSFVLMGNGVSRRTAACRETDKDLLSSGQIKAHKHRH